MRTVNVAREHVIEPCSLDLFDYQVDPYVGCAHHCVYCYTQNDCAVKWDSEVGVLTGLETRVDRELEAIPPQTLYMGMNTDPYQPVEDELQQTRTVLDMLGRRGFAVCILTKSALVLRDIDLIGGMPGSSVGFSLAFTHDGIRRVFEKDTIPTEERIEALAALKKEGIETYALIDPVIPYITEIGPLIDSVAAHVDSIWIYPLHMADRGDRNWLATREVLVRHFQEAFPDIERAAFDNRAPYWKQLRKELHAARSTLAPRLEIRV